MRERSAITLKRYGLTRNSFIALYQKQNGRCAICRISEDDLLLTNVIISDRVLHIDHDHKTGRVRGLLCSTCNFTLHAYEQRAPCYAPNGYVYQPPGPLFASYYADYLIRSAE